MCLLKDLLDKNRAFSPTPADNNTRIARNLNTSTHRDRDHNTNTQPPPTRARSKSHSQSQSHPHRDRDRHATTRSKHQHRHSSTGVTDIPPTTSSRPHRDSRASVRVGAEKTSDREKRRSVQGALTATSTAAVPTRERSRRYQYRDSDDAGKLNRRHTVTTREGRDHDRRERRKSVGGTTGKARGERSRSIGSRPSRDKIAHSRNMKRPKSSGNKGSYDDDDDDDDDDEGRSRSESVSSNGQLGPQRPRPQRSLSSHRRQQHSKARTLSQSSSSRPSVANVSKKRRSGVEAVVKDSSDGIKVRESKRRSGFEKHTAPPKGVVREPMTGDIVTLETVGNLAAGAPPMPQEPKGRREPRLRYDTDEEGAGGNEHRTIESKVLEHVAAAGIQIPEEALRELVARGEKTGETKAANLGLPVAAVPDLVTLGLYDLLILCDDTSPPFFTQVLTTTNHLIALHSTFSPTGSALRFYAHPADRGFNGLSTSAQLSTVTSLVTPIRGDHLWLGHNALHKVLANRRKTLTPAGTSPIKPLLVVLVIAGKLVAEDGGLWRDLVKATWNVWGRGIRWCVVGVGKEGRRSARRCREEGEGGVWAPRMEVGRVMEKAKGVGEVNAWLLQCLMEAVRA